LVAEHKTLKVPKPGNNLKSKRRKGRQNKKRPDKDDSSSDEETDSKALAKIARAVALVLKGKKHHQSIAIFVERQAIWVTKCFLNPSNPNNPLPDKLREKLLVASSDEKKQKPKKLIHDSIEIVAMVRSTVLKAEKTTIKPPKDSPYYLDSGATCSIFFSRQAFVPGTLRVCNPRPIRLADTSEIRAKMSGVVILEIRKEDGSPTAILRITGCLYVEDLGYNLIAVGKLADKGITSIFRAETVELKIEPKTLILGRGI
jgi:hypothetical protein